ncbi:Uncharacterised protein [Raoultella planticola]|uniref:Uncharacterized protein n=1 Tax=Raoultella planticola TaxID=575 RepID=A0A485D2L2_RAOPL|nr:Uncharacterised protein [Raoultella planticola]
MLEIYTIAGGGLVSGKPECHCCFYEYRYLVFHRENVYRLFRADCRQQLGEKA